MPLRVVVVWRVLFVVCCVLGVVCCLLLVGWCCCCVFVVMLLGGVRVLFAGSVVCVFDFVLFFEFDVCSV